MRWSTCFVLSGLIGIASSVPAAEKIPQDRTRAEKRSHDWLEWNRRTLGGAYDEVGLKDPRWDAKAREAMEQAARMFSQQVDPLVKWADVFEPADAAVKAGCTDPMVLYLHNRTNMKGYAAPLAEQARLMKEVATKLAASKYPALRKAFAHRFAGDALYRSGPKDQAVLKQAKEHYDAVLEQLTAGVAGDARGPFWEDRCFECLNGVTGGYRAMDVEPIAAYERVDAALAKVPSLEALRFKFRGNFWARYGWEARGQSFAILVPQGGFAKMEERLEQARPALEKSWALQPDAHVADLMMAIDKTAFGDRQTMETWFERAIEADLDFRDAYWSKLDWLDPKWHGSWEEMLAFGHDCAATGNWRNGITLLGGDAHHRVAKRLPTAQASKYLSDPRIWSDVGPAYDEYLKHYPDDAVAKSKYAVLCHLAGRDREAHALFQQLGDDLTNWSEVPNYPLETLKQMRSDAARAADSPPKDDAQSKGPQDPVLP